MPKKPGDKSKRSTKKSPNRPNMPAIQNFAKGEHANPSKTKGGVVKHVTRARPVQKRGTKNKTRKPKK